MKRPLAPQGTLGLVSDVRRESRRSPGSGHKLEFPGCPVWLCNRLSSNAQVGCETLPASGVEAGTDCRRCCASLSDSESARLGRGAPGADSDQPPGPGPITWTMIYLTAVLNLPYPLSIQPAREAGKWAWSEAPGQVGPKQNLGRIRNTSLKFSKVQARAL